LRSDLHLLFDEGLFEIHPETLTVKIDPALKGSPYWRWNGTKSADRVDGGRPKEEYLREALDREQAPA